MSKKSFFNPHSRRVSVAPMMDCTDRHDRYFLRLLAPDILLYTEMVTTGALIYGDTERFLKFDALEHPVALQLGGNDPEALARCTTMGVDFGYDEINLNVGCPSARVKSGRFGACLMQQPDLIADCVHAMQSVAKKIPVTVKCRIGVDEQDSYEALIHFIQKVADAGCKIFIIHARKAWLNGLSPKQNREIPPLRYDVVRQVKQDFPQLSIVINGGIKTLAEIEEHLQFVDGVMIGREAYANPFLLTEIQNKIFAGNTTTRHAVIEKFLPYLEEQLKNNIRLSSITRHILGLYHGEKGGRLWRRYLSENAHQSDAGVKVVKDAMHLVTSESI